MTIQKVSQGKKVDVDLLTGLGNLNTHIVHQLNLLNQPINQHSEESKKTIQANLYSLLEDQLDLILLGFEKKGLYQDPVGLLDNKHILGNRNEIKTSSIIPIIIKRLLKDKEDIIMSRQTAAQKAAKQQQANNQPKPTTVEAQKVVEAVKPSEPVTPLVDSTKTPVAQAVQKVIEEESITDVEDFNYDFHKPYIAKVTELLGKLNGLIESDPTFISTKSQLLEINRSWINSFYKNILSSSEQKEGEKYITKDVYNILDGDNPFSDVKYLDYDYVHIISEQFEVVRKKHQVQTNNEVSVETAVKTLLDLQDDSKPIVEIETNTTQKESISVNKTTGDIEVKKDNIVVRFFKGTYNGFLNFCSNLKNLWLRFWTWCKSWFSKEEKVIISKEEYESLTGKTA